MSYFVIQLGKDGTGVEVVECDDVEQVLKEFSRFDYFYLPLCDALDGAIGEIIEKTEQPKIFVIKGSVVVPEMVSIVGLVEESSLVNGSSLQ